MQYKHLRTLDRKTHLQGRQLCQMVSAKKGVSSKFVCVEVVQPSQSNGVMSSMVIYLSTLLLDRLSRLSG